MLKENFVENKLSFLHIFVTFFDFKTILAENFTKKKQFRLNIETNKKERIRLIDKKLFTFKSAKRSQ